MVQCDDISHGLNFVSSTGWKLYHWDLKEECQVGLMAAVEFAFFDRDVDRRWINDDPTLILNNISDQCFVNVDNMYRNQR